MKVVADLPLETGECPHWNPLDGCLYWIDVPTGRLYCYDLAKDRYALVFEADQQIGALVVAEDGSLVLGLEKGRVIRWSPREIHVICEGIAEERGRRFNDGIVDRMGRILLGTMPGEQIGGRLYRFSADGAYEVLLNDAGQSNGMAFSLDGQTLYHTDTSRRTISAYPYVAAPLTSGQTLVRLTEQDVVPDGLTIDSDGNLWSAHYGGSCITCYDSAGKVLKEMKLPVLRPTCPAFAGPDLGLMFITSAGGEKRKEYGEYSGALFVEQSLVRGVPSTLGKVDFRVQSPY